MKVGALLPHDVAPEQIAAAVAGVVLVMALALSAIVYVYMGAVVTGVVAIAEALLAWRWVYWNALGIFGWHSPWLRDSAELSAQLFSEPKQKGTLRVVCISDTHGRHRNVQVPEGDILIHCGDFTRKGTHKEIADFNDWMGTLPHRHKLVIAGNHDLSMDAAEYSTHWQTPWRHAEFQDPHVSHKLLTTCTYVEHRSVVIEGVKIFGSPMTPPIPGRVMAFNVSRGFAAQQHWAKIPSDVDILVTHGPPHGILDRTFTALHVGDEALLKEVMSRCRPRFHVFGHIHEAYGISRVGKTVFINASTSTLLGKPQHRPVVFDIPSKC